MYTECHKLRYDYKSLRKKSPTSYLTPTTAQNPWHVITSSYIKDTITVFGHTSRVPCETELEKI